MINTNLGIHCLLRYNYPNRYGKYGILSIAMLNKFNFSQSDNFVQVGETNSHT